MIQLIVLVKGYSKYKCVDLDHYQGLSTVARTCLCSGTIERFDLHFLFPQNRNLSDYTSHVLCKHSNGKRISQANLNQL